MSARTKHGLAVAYSLPFVWVGLMHFVNPAVFDPIVPAYLGKPRFWVLITGVTEIAVALGIVWPRTRHLACRLMIAQLALLYLANLNMWQHDIPFDGMTMGSTAHWVRLFVQLLLMVLAAMIGGLWPFGSTAEPSGSQPENGNAE